MIKHASRVVLDYRPQQGNVRVFQGVHDPH